MGDWRNAEGYVPKLFGWWRLKYDYPTILMSELLDNGIKNDDPPYEISDIEWFLLKDTTKAQLVEGRNISDLIVLKHSYMECLKHIKCF